MDMNEFSAKVVESVNNAAAKNNENLAVADKEGNIKSIPAKELLKELSK